MNIASHKIMDIDFIVKILFYFLINYDIFLELLDYVMKHEFLALFLYFLSKYDTKF